MTDINSSRDVSPATPHMTQLERTLEKVYEVSERLARCAEAVTNPTYSVYLQTPSGREILPVVSVRMVAGQIMLTVKLPDAPDPNRRQTAVEVLEE